MQRIDLPLRAEAATAAREQQEQQPVRPPTVTGINAHIDMLGEGRHRDAALNGESKLVHVVLKRACIGALAKGRAGRSSGLSYVGLPSAAPDQQRPIHMQQGGSEVGAVRRPVTRGPLQRR